MRTPAVRIDGLTLCDMDDMDLRGAFLCSVPNGAAPASTNVQQHYYRHKFALAGDHDFNLTVGLGVID
jgi:hypothetical protein